MTWRIPSEIASVAEPERELLWVLPLVSGRIHALDVVSQIIWAAADGAEDVDDVLDRLTAEQGWQREEIATHVAYFIDQLLQYELVEETPNA